MSNPDAKFTWSRGHLDARLNVAHCGGVANGAEQAAAHLRKAAGEAFAADNENDARVLKMAAIMIETHVKRPYESQLRAMQKELESWEVRDAD